MRRNFNVLPAAKFSRRFKNLGLVKVEHEMNFLAVLYQVVALVGRSRLGFIERQVLAVAQQISLDIAGGRDFKHRGCGCEDQRAAWIHFDLDDRRLRRRGLGFGFELRTIATRGQERNECNHDESADEKKRRCSLCPPA